MKSVIVLACIAAATFAQFQHQQISPLSSVVPFVSRSEIRDEAGQYSLSYATGDGIGVAEQGVLKTNSEGTGHVLVKQGTVSYTSPEGTPITLTYVADENGFQPSGSHLPRPVEAVASKK